MTVVIKGRKQLYPTKRLDCWNRGKELRVEHFEGARTANERGEVLVLGGLGSSFVFEGFGGCANIPGESYGAEVSRFPELAAKALETVEAAGYARDLCSYMRNYWGSALSGLAPWGEFPKPDIVFQTHFCDSHAQWFRMLADHFNIPYYFVETPTTNYCTDQPKHWIDYQVEQWKDAIEWLEKQLKKPFDVEKYIEAVLNSRKVADLWDQILELNKAIPAPLDGKSMFAMRTPLQDISYKQEAVDFYTMMRDEMKDRVAQGIAAVPNEQARLGYDNVPPWFALHTFRYMEKWGAVCMAGDYMFFNRRFLRDRPDGSFGYMPPEPQPRPRNLEEALRYDLHDRQSRGLTTDNPRLMNPKIVKNWSLDGYVFHLNRGCEGQSAGRQEGWLAVREMGLPTMAYEASTGDRRDYDESQVMRRIDAFMESLGLTRPEL